MLWFNLKFILRNIKKNKAYSAINLFGIVIGFSVSALLLIYVKSQVEANRSFPDSERIYRVETNGYRNTSRKKVAVLRDYLPEVEHITKYHSSWSRKDVINYKDRDYEVKDAFYADSAFFRVFNFECIYGNLTTSIDEPYAIVITKSEAEKVFGNFNPVGEIVTLKTTRYGIHDYTIKAVIKDIPNDCSFKFDAVFALSSLNAVDSYNSDANNWGSNFYTSFAKLADNTDPIEAAKSAELLYNEYAPEWSRDMKIAFSPLIGLNFSAKYGDGVFQGSNKSIITILGVIAILVLLMACFNYFNLSRAQLEERLKSMAINKTVGARSKNLRFQSLLETSLLFLVAFSISLWVIKIILPFFNRLTYASFHISDILSSSNFLFVVGYFLVALLLFSFFPMLLINRINVVRLLQSNKKDLGKGGVTKDILIGFQFLIAIVLITSTIILNRQYRFMINADAGFSKESIVYFPLNTENTDKLDLLEQELESNANVQGVAFSSNLLGQVANSWGRTLFINGEEKDVKFEVLGVSQDFLDLFDIQLAKGNTFSETSYSRQDIIVNEAFVNKYNLTDPLSGNLGDREQGNIIGVTKDFNYNPLRSAIGPLVILCNKGWSNVMFVRFQNANSLEIKRTLAAFKKTWDKTSPNYLFEYFFFDEQYAENYKAELHIMKILTTVSILIILIAALGLVGIARHIIIKRTKEIGIRKVNGAKTREVMALLSNSFSIKVIIAFVFACPLIYILTNKWLEFYAYKINIPWWAFLAGGLFALVTALLSVGVQVYRVANQNPVKALRYE